MSVYVALLRGINVGGSNLIRMAALKACVPITRRRALVRADEGDCREAPKGFGRQPAAYRYDVIFLKDPLTPDAAMKSVNPKPGVDRVFAGDGVLYFSRLISRAAQSHLSRVVGTPAYQNMTIRNWNTTARLLDAMKRIQSG
jgi:uncharacterized protein (DUF1697 family)